MPFGKVSAGTIMDPSQFCAGIQNDAFLKDDEQPGLMLFGLAKLPLTRYVLDTDVLSPTLLARFHGQQPVCEIIEIDDDIRLSSIASDFEGMDFDCFALKRARVSYKNFSIHPRDRPGWHFDADISIDAKSGDLHEAISTIVGHDTNSLDIHLHADLPLGLSWTKPCSLTSFVLSGSISNLDHKVFVDYIRLRELGVKLIGFTRSKWSSKCKAIVPQRQYGYGVYGTIVMDKPTCGSQVQLEFELTKMLDNYDIIVSATTDWVDIFGIKGIKLCGLDLRLTFASKKALSSMVFSASATLVVGKSTNFTISGTFSFEGDFTITAVVQNFKYENVKELYRSVFDDDLPDLPYDVSMDCGAITVYRSGSSFGVSLAVSNLKIDQFTNISGTLIISSTQFLIEARASGHFEIGTVQIENPFVRIAYVPATKTTPKSASFTISGSLSWKSIRFNVAAHLQKSAPGAPLEYLIFGELIASKELTIGSVIPELAGNEVLDAVSIRHLKVAVVSAVLPEFQSIMGTDHQIVAGFQIYGAIGCIDRLKSALNGKGELTLMVDVSENGKCALGIQLPLNMITFDKGTDIKMDALTLSVAFGPNTTPVIAIKGGLIMTVKGQTAPLIFGLSCALAATGNVTIAGSMKGFWTNPFDLSEKLKIGNLYLMGSFLMPAFTPTALGASGTLMINNATAQATFLVSASEGQFISFSVTNLTYRDIAEFLHLVYGIEIDKDHDFVSFTTVSLYICSGRVTILEKTYERGLRIVADVTILNKSASLDLDISTSGLAFHARIDPFKIGPLSISGFDKDKLVLDLTLKKGQQNGKMSGRIALDDIGINAALKAEFALQPPLFKFDFALKFGDALNLDAVGTTSGGGEALKNAGYDVSDVDYFLDVNFKTADADEVKRLVKDKCEEYKRAVQKWNQEYQQAIDDRVKASQQFIDDMREKLHDVLGDTSKKLYDVFKYVDDSCNALDKALATFERAIYDELVGTQLLDHREKALIRYREYKQERTFAQFQQDVAALKALMELRKGVNKKALLPLILANPKAGLEVSAKEFISKLQANVEFDEEVVVNTLHHSIEHCIKYSRRQCMLLRLLVRTLPQKRRQFYSTSYLAFKTVGDLTEQRYSSAIAQGGLFAGTILDGLPLQAEHIISFTGTELSDIALDLASLAVDAGGATAKLAGDVGAGMAQAVLSAAPSLFDGIINTFYIHNIHLQAVVKKSTGELSFTATAKVTISSKEYNLELQVVINFKKILDFVEALLKKLLEMIKEQTTNSLKNAFSL